MPLRSRSVKSQPVMCHGHRPAAIVLEACVAIKALLTWVPGDCESTARANLHWIDSANKKTIGLVLSHSGLG